jgi:hypothetical protein
MQVARVLAVLAVGACAVLAGGCGKQEDIHPALRIEGDDLERAKRQGCSLINLGADPYEAYARDFRDVNKRLTAHVILRSAACCWPQDEVAFQIAQSGDASEAAVNQAAKEAVELTRRVIKFAAVLQMPKDRDPVTIEFALRTSTGTEYPALEVEEPYYIRDAKSYYDEHAPASGMYYYMVKFPVRGGGGIPPIGPGVNMLYLVVRDGDMEADAEFVMPRPSPKR